MFETRLKIVLATLALAMGVLVLRLLDLQVVRAGEFRKQAEEALLHPPETLPFVRGRILDRLGTELAADRASWDIVLDYGLLAMDPAYLQSRADQLRRQNGISPREATEQLYGRIAAMWRELAIFEGADGAELVARAREICTRVDAVREAVAGRRGFDAPIAEESMRHPIIAGLDDQRQVAARRMLEPYPWAEVRDSTQRFYHASESLPHILGQQVAVSEKALERDPDSDDPLASYLVSDLIGGSGVEYAAEQRLRGRRGVRRKSRAGAVVESVEAVSGKDVSLTVRLDLQSALFDLLQREIPGIPESVGGAVVVLDVPTREVLALVSYPGYDNNRFRADYDRLVRDSKYQPLRFRAVASGYAPGSIVKPLACAAGLSSHRISLATSFTCEGYLNPPTRSGPRCWQVHGTDTRMVHGPLTVSDAIAHSCNIFMYKTGEAVGVDGLCWFFDRAGLGRLSGLNLLEEAPGIAAHGEEATPGRARNLAIGQGEIVVTPVQAANLMAVYASGVLKPMTLLRNAPERPACEPLPVNAQDWAAIRAGLFRVTNEVGATAYQYAHFVRDGYAMCGKTGSATASPWPISFKIPYTTDEGRQQFSVQFANTRKQALEQFRSDHAHDGFDPEKASVNEWWPEPPRSEGPHPSHAWFIAYLQPVDGQGQPLLHQAPHIAFSVLVEFGGSGGRSAGPIAAKVAGTLLDVLGPSLDPDAPRGQGPGVSDQESQP